jgi:hypothetical protein
MLGLERNVQSVKARTISAAFRALDARCRLAKISRLDCIFRNQFAAAPILQRGARQRFSMLYIRAYRES